MLLVLFGSSYLKAMSFVKDGSHHTLFMTKKLATYTSADEFDQESAAGFIKLWGLPTQVYAQVQAKNQTGKVENTGVEL